MEEKISCPDCGKFLQKVVECEGKTVLLCWCRRCREEKTIKIEPRA